VPLRARKAFRETSRWHLPVLRQTRCDAIPSAMANDNKPESVDLQPKPMKGKYDGRRFNGSTKERRRTNPNLGLKPAWQKHVTRDDIKAFMSELTDKGLSRNTIRLAVAALSVVLSSAVEEGILTTHPGLRLGRFLRSQKAKRAAQAMTREEARAFLETAKEFYPEVYPLFLMALRAGLRQGELIAIKWGDIQSEEARRIPIDTSLCSTITCTTSLRRPRTGKSEEWICPEDDAASCWNCGISACWRHS